MIQLHCSKLSQRAGFQHLACGLSQLAEALLNTVKTFIASTRQSPSAYRENAAAASSACSLSVQEALTCSWRRSVAEPLLGRPELWMRPPAPAAGGLPAPLAAPWAAMADQLAGWGCCCCCWPMLSTDFDSGVCFPVSGVLCMTVLDHFSHSLPLLTSQMEKVLARQLHTVRCIYRRLSLVLTNAYIQQGGFYKRERELTCCEVTDGTELCRPSAYCFSGLLLLLCRSTVTWSCAEAADPASFPDCCAAGRPCAGLSCGKP